MADQQPPKPQTATVPPPTTLESAPAAATTLTPERRRTLFAELRSRMGRSQIEVVPPAGKHGYWAPTDDTREMGRLAWLGFTIVHDDPKKPIWKANGAKSDGTYVIGDVILMEIAEEIYEFYQQEYRDLNLAQRTNAARTFQEDAESQGVPAFEVAKPKR